MKIILLPLILLPFLSSCSIDWNGENDAKIADLENQVTELQFKKSQLEQTLSGSNILLNDGSRKLEALQIEIDTMREYTLTKLDSYLNNKSYIEKIGDEYTYKKDVFDGKNTGICYISNNFNLTKLDEALEVLEKCKPGNIVIGSGELNVGENCILTPDGAYYSRPDTDQWKKIGEYYTATDRYILFRNRGMLDACYELIQTDPAKFQVSTLKTPYWEGEYGTDGMKVYSSFGIYNSKAELEKELNEYKNPPGKTPNKNDAIDNSNTPLATEYYSSLLKSCGNLELSEQEGCLSSVKHMEEKGYKEAIRNADGTYFCKIISEKTGVQSFMTPGSKTWCIE